MEVPFLRRGTQGRSAAAVVIAPHSGAARYPPSSPQARAPQSLRRRANLPGSGVHGHSTPLWGACSAEVIRGPFCAHPRPAPSPLHSRPPFPETPGLPTSSLTPVPLALRFGLPSHLSVDGGAENGFSDGICVQEHRGAEDGVWKRRGPPGEEMALTRAAVGSQHRLCSFPDFAPDSRCSSTLHRSTHGCTETSDLWCPRVPLLHGSLGSRPTATACLPQRLSWRACAGPPWCPRGPSAV